MDIGDIIFFLIVIGLPLVQWLTRKKGEEEALPEDDLREFDAGEPQDTTYRPKRDISDPNREWEDLMEALGRPTVVTEEDPSPVPEPARQPVKSSPPPVPDPAPLPRLDPRVERMNQMLKRSQGGTARQVEAGLATERRGILNLPTTDSPSFGRRRLQSILRNRQSIRDAILVNEILGKPVAMRNTIS